MTRTTGPDCAVVMFNLISTHTKTETRTEREREREQELR